MKGVARISYGLRLLSVHVHDGLGKNHGSLWERTFHSAFR